LPEVLNATLYPKRKEINSAILAIVMDCLMPAFMSLRELRTIAGDHNVGVLNKVKRFDDICKSP